MKKELQRECQNAYNNYVNNLVSEDDSHISKRLWSLIKKQRCDYCGFTSLEDCGTIHNNPKKNLKIPNKFFTSVLT